MKHIQYRGLFDEGICGILLHCWDLVRGINDTHYNMLNSAVGHFLLKIFEKKTTKYQIFILSKYLLRIAISPSDSALH